MTTNPSTLPDPTAAYAALRERVSELVHAAEEDQLQAIAQPRPSGECTMWCHTWWA